MPTGYEVQMYHDIAIIAQELRGINRSLKRWVELMEAEVGDGTSDDGS